MQGPSRRRIRRIAFAAAVSAWLPALATVGHADPRVVRASSELDFPPLALVRPNGEADGFTVALFRAVAATMHLQTQIRVAPFGEIKDDLAADRADVLLNLAWSEPRARSVDFGVPHTRTSGAIFVRRAHPVVGGEPDLPRARIAVIRGDLAHDWVLAQGWGERVAPFDTAEEAMRQLAAGTVDCALMARLVGAVTLRRLGLDGAIEVTGGQVSGFEQRFAFAVRKGNAELLAKLNEGLAIVMADGTYAKLYHEWFASYEPIGISAAEIVRVAVPVGLAGIGLLVWLNLRLSRSTRALRVAGEGLERRVDERTAELRSSLSLLEATLESTADGILVLDLLGLVTTFNERFAELWRIPREMLRAGEREAALRFAIDQLADPEAALTKVQEIEANPEAESFDVLYFKDGRVFERHSQPQRVDGAPIGRVWSFRDVTARRSAEQRFLELAESVPEIFFVYDAASDRLLYVNSAFETIWGRPHGSVFRSLDAFLACLHPDDRGARLAARARQLAGEETSLEYRIVRPDGGVRWLWERTFPVRSTSGALLRLHGTATDITERKAIEAEHQAFERNLQQTQKLESLGLLAGGVAHDFNNLLTGILGQASLARTHLPADAPLAEPFAEIEEAALRAAELCRQMLAYAGKSTLTNELLDLDLVIESTLQLLRVSLGRRVRLRWEPCKEACPVLGDATQLRQVVMNLVLNASEAIGADDGTIEVATEVDDADRGELPEARIGGALPEGRHLRITVRDDGPGMDPDTLARIFDPFFTTKFAGRGLGLAAVLGIVRAHRGAIHVESAPGAGTRFLVLLPIAEGSVGTATAAAAVPAPPAGSGAILVVDDEDLVRRLVARGLEAAGYEVMTARGGHDAIAAVEAAPARFALVVLDLTMPELDGRETHDRLQRVAPGLPVLLMSGYDERDATDRFVGSAPAGFLGKPFTVGELRTRVAAVLAAAARRPTRESADAQRAAGERSPSASSRGG